MDWESRPLTYRALTYNNLCVRVLLCFPFSHLSKAITTKTAHSSPSLWSSLLIAAILLLCSNHSTPFLAAILTRNFLFGDALLQWIQLQRLQGGVRWATTATGKTDWCHRQILWKLFTVLKVVRQARQLLQVGIGNRIFLGPQKSLYRMNRFRVSSWPVWTVKMCFAK